MTYPCFSRAALVASAIAAAEIAAITATILLTSCSIDLFSADGVTVILPETPPVLVLAAHGKPLSWTLSWYDENGKKQTECGVTGNTTIEFARGTFTPVLLVPETRASGIPLNSIPCAGALYPAECAEKNAAFMQSTITLPLSWIGGVSASMAEAMCLHSTGSFSDGRTIASHVNWQKFEETAAALDEPNLIDRERFVEAALGGSITKWDVSLPDAIDIVFPASLSGTLKPASGEVFLPAWPGGSAFSWPSPEPDAETDAATVTRSVREGVTHFYSASGYLTVAVKNGKREAAFFTPYSLQD